MEINKLSNIKPAPQTFFRLSTSNYYPWSKIVLPYLHSQGCEIHLIHDTFADYYNSKDHTKTDREIKFNLRKKEIAESKTLTDKEKEAELDPLETKYSDLDNKKAREEKEWKTQQSQIKGILTGLVDEHIWLNAGKKETVKQIWTQLVLESQTKEVGNYISQLVQFFSATQKENESLVDYASRVQLIGQKLLDLGPAPTWDEVLVFRVLSGLKAKQFENVQSQIFQLSRAEIKIDSVESRFAAEDSYRQSQQQQQPQTEKKQQQQNAEDACVTTDARACTTCKATLPSRSPSYHTRCRSCQDKWIKEKKEKSLKKEEKPTEAQVIYYF